MGVVVDRTLPNMWLVEKGINLAADTAERARVYVDPGISTYATALQCRAAFFLGQIDHANQLFHETRAMLAHQPSIHHRAALIHLGRQALDFGEPLPTLRCQLKNDNIDQFLNQWNLLLARESKSNPPPLQLQTPWSAGYGRLDRFSCLKSVQSTSIEVLEPLLEDMWVDFSKRGMGGLTIIAARYGVASFNTLKWKNSLLESINICVGKQPEHFTLQDHWLSPHALLA